MNSIIEWIVDVELQKLRLATGLAKLKRGAADGLPPCAEVTFEMEEANVKKRADSDVPLKVNN